MKNRLISALTALCTAFSCASPLLVNAENSFITYTENDYDQVIELFFCDQKMSGYTYVDYRTDITKVFCETEEDIEKVKAYVKEKEMDEFRLEFFIKNKSFTAKSLTYNELVKMTDDEIVASVVAGSVAEIISEPWKFSLGIFMEEEKCHTLPICPLF